MADRKPLADIIPPTEDISHPTISLPPKEVPLPPPPPSKARSLRIHSTSSGSSSNYRDLRENIRVVPPSPRAARHSSLPQSAIDMMFTNVPISRPGESKKFSGRDWKSIKVCELVDEENVCFVGLDTPVETTTQMLIESGAPVILLRETADSKVACGTFDYTDLNAYLLLVVGLVQPEEGDMSSFQELAKKAREGNPVPVKHVKNLGKKNAFITLPESALLPTAVEIFGSGLHRIAIVKDGTNEVVGVLSQLRLVEFFWENGRSFTSIDQLYPQQLKDLAIGSSQVIAINGDKPLSAALELMNCEGVSSLAVIDNQNNVVGNISTVDVKHLTRSTSLPLLWSSCIHFVSVILSDRGLMDGKDSFPVFHVNPYSTLAHTVAKLIATRSHRMWVVDAPSPGSSVPQTPVSQLAVTVPPPGVAPSMPPPGAMPFPSPSVSASAAPGALLSGRLSGVVSLTDILNLFARSSGLTPVDPTQARKQRRRSSSSSIRVSMDSARSSS
ncbi:MAG: cell separation during budding [Trichoglossum hirsutum]|nr:MAG: cell separation during budding [Trichoglossum hirsutum]